MGSTRRRPLIYAGLGLVAVWLLAGAGYLISHQAKMTAEKVADYLQAVDLGKLSGESRARALREAARRLNALSPDERRKARLAGDWERWFAGMTEQEKAEFIEATMPSGFKQMLVSFEQLPEEKRRRVIADSLREMRKTRDSIESDAAEETSLRPGTNAPPQLSEELQQKVVKLGLQTFYSQSSAQTKAELAPVLEEMQHLMESGALFRGQRRP